MGREKALAMLASKPLVKYVINAVAEVAEEVIISVPPGASERFEGVSPTAIIVEDSSSGVGPLEGLINAFRVARENYVAVAPCDTPFLRAEVVMLIAKRALEAEGALPMVRGLPEPLHGVYRRDVFLRAFEDAATRGVRKVQDALAGHKLFKVEEVDLRALDPDLLSFMNINSPEDLATAERLLHHS